MPNKFLVAIDRQLQRLDKIQFRCRKIHTKPLTAITALVLCCTIVAFLGRDMLKKLMFLKNPYYDTVVACLPDFVDFLNAPLAKVICAIFTLLVFFVWAVRLFYKKPALLIAHSTMGHNLGELDKELSKNFYFKEIDISEKLPPRDAKQNEIEKAIEIQDNIYNQIKQNNWRSTVFFYGVAHTPLVFHLGYQFGQTQSLRLLHRFRPKEDVQEFIELPQYDNDTASFLTEEIRDVIISSQDMIVAIGTTYTIKDEDLKIIKQGQNMYIYKRQVNDEIMGYDFFNSYQKIRNYSDRFTYDIRKICKERNIRRIHLVLSTSVPFTFYLAQQMNTNQFPEIIVYHYDHGRYTWGINMNHESVVWLKSVNEKNICTNNN